MTDADIVVLAAVRTAHGRFQGGFANTSAVELAEVVMREALVRAGVAGEQLSEVIFGNAIQAGQGQNPARQAMLKAGIPAQIPALTVNRVCVSSSSALAIAANAITAGDGSLFLVGGTENMTRAPWLMLDGRSGYRMGLPTGQIHDSMVWDGLWCAVGDYHMGVTAENLCSQFGVTREAQDAAAHESHARAIAAIDDGRFASEITPVVVPQRKAEPLVVATDECPRRDVSPASLTRLKPFFQEGVVVTAGNSSAIADGASALVVASRRRATELGLRPIAELLSQATVGVAPEIMGVGAARAAQVALERAGLKPGDVDLAEFNEAFACVSLLATRETAVDPAIVNVNGGAIALGHPLGSTGTRMLVSLIHELRRRGGGVGLTGACVGGGQGTGSVIRTIN